MSPAARRLIIGLVFLIGLAAIAAGVIYLTNPAHALPSFFPGHAKGNYHHHKYGYGGVVLGVILVIGAIIAWVRDRQHSRSYY